MTAVAWGRPSDIARLATGCAWLLLLAVQFADAWSAQLPWVFWVAKVAPLLLFLPGLWRENLRSHIWLCFVCLLYFLVLVERLFAEPDSPLAITGMVAVVVLFNAAMLFVRWRARELRQDQ